VARIFVVDDSLMIRSLLREILSGAGHEVVGEAGDGITAEERFRELVADPALCPDVVTMNLVMPARGGMHTISPLLAIHPGVAIVICSASLDRQRVVRATRLGVAGFVLKPFTRDTVLVAIDRALAQVSSARLGSGDDANIAPASYRAGDSHDERREFVRVDIRRLVHVTPEKGDAFMTATLNISGGGMLLEAGRVDVGDAVGFRLELGGGEAVIGRAHVARIDAEGRPGIAFDQVSVDDHERLVELLRLEVESADCVL
jgi:two-component system chemotaxis response regulator CheY